MSNIPVLATVSSQVDAGGRGLAPPVFPHSRVQRFIYQQCSLCGAWQVLDTALGQTVGGWHATQQEAIDSVLPTIRRWRAQVLGMGVAS